jgi:selenide,water dikinase
MVDDPYAFGQIAATNALNDVYAMGGRPLTAMNILCYPACGDMEVLAAILQGGADKVAESGAALAGGHSVDDNEPKFGLSVTGIVHPERYLTNSALNPGDHIFLTKPLGTGVITTAIKGEIASQEAANAAVATMSTLNRDASEAMIEVGATGCTDVTGFGFLGHLLEMAEGADVAMELLSSNLIFLPSALEYAAMGLLPAGAYRNRDYVGVKASADTEIDKAILDTIVTPETAGGLLIGVPGAKADQMAEALARRGVKASMVARVTAPGFAPIRVRR